MICGWERLTLRVVAKHADWWNIPNASAETFRHKLEVLEKHCKRVGRDPEEIKKTIGEYCCNSGDSGKTQRIAAEKPIYKREEDRELHNRRP